MFCARLALAKGGKRFIEGNPGSCASGNRDRRGAFQCSARLSVLTFYWRLRPTVSGSGSVAIMASAVSSTTNMIRKATMIRLVAIAFRAV